MTITIPNIEAYPKTIMLRDGSTVTVRPLEPEDKVELLWFFERVPEEERHYLKENVTAPEVVYRWTEDIDFDRVIPIVAVANGEIVADATLHRTRIEGRRHVGELRIIVDPALREAGLGSRLMRELMDIGQEIGLYSATMELVADRELPAILAAESVGFKRVARLSERVRDFWGNYQDLIILDLPLKDRLQWWF
jgi:RimJ/RimL family protein N-acetyltransferase